MNRNLIGPSIWDWKSGEEFVAHTKSLVIRRESSKESRVVSGVTIIVGKKLMIRVNRNPKVITDAELTLLAQEYDMSRIDLRDHFLKRKITVLDVNGEPHAKPARAKKNARDPKKRGQVDCPHEQQLTGSYSDMSAKSSLQPEPPIEEPRG